MLKDRSPRRRPNVQSHNNGYRRGFRWNIRWPLVLALAPLLFAAAGSYFVLNSSLLSVNTIRVEGAIRLDKASLAQISGLYGSSMLTLSEGDAQRRLLAIPDVRAAGISREWPDTVVITVHERTPVAFWSVAGHDFPVDQDGVVLSAGAPDGPAPRIVEVTPGRVLAPGDRVHPDAIAFAQRIMAESPQFLDARVSELEYKADVGVTVIFEGGLRVTFGDDRSYDYKVAVLSQLLQQLADKNIQPSAVDLRFGERVTYE